MFKNLLRRSAGALALGLAVLTPVSAAPKIGVLLKGHSPFWDAVEEGAMAAAKKAGVDLVMKVPPTELDVAIQVQMLNALVNQGVDAIVVAPSSKETLSGPVAAAEAKGVKIVVLDSPLAGDHVFVGTDHADAGTAAGKLLATLVTEADEVSFLKHIQNNGATTLRETSAYAALRAALPKLTINRDIYSGAETGLEVEKANFLLTQHPGTKAVLASGTPGTMAMLRVLQARNGAGNVKLVGFGFDLNPTVAAAIEQGTLTGWVAQLPQEIGGRGVEAAVGLIKGTPVAKQISCDFMIITKANLKDANVQALLPQ